MAPAADSKSRFTNRVNDYVKSRPSYPKEVVEFLANEFNLRPGAVIADLGSGTGISSNVFLENLKDKDVTVVGVEPNQAMREAAESLLSSHVEAQRFVSLGNSAEETGIDSKSVDLIIAGQAFHWFDVDKTRAECQRISKGGSKAGVALLWNERRGMDEQTAGNEASQSDIDYSRLDSPVMSAYDLLLKDLPTDYLQVSHHKTVDEGVLNRFFGQARFKVKTFRNPYRLSLDQLKGRLLSSSYTPQEGEEGYDQMMRNLKELFEKYQTDGKVDFVYDCQVFYGTLS